MKSDKIYAEFEALDNYYIDIEEWQTRTDLDILDFSTLTTGPPSDAVWDAAVKATSNILDLYRRLGFQSPVNYVQNQSAIDVYESTLTQ